MNAILAIVLFIAVFLGLHELGIRDLISAGIAFAIAIAIGFN